MPGKEPVFKPGLAHVNGNNSVCYVILMLSFYNEETEAQKVLITCPRSNQYFTLAELGLDLVI